MNLVGRIKKLEAVLAPPDAAPWGRVIVQGDADPRPAIREEYGDSAPENVIVRRIIDPRGQS